MERDDIAKRVIEELTSRGFKAQYCGSSARGDPRANSDIDVAVILGDSMRLVPLDFQGNPLYVMDIATRLAKHVKDDYGYVLDISVYWPREYRYNI